MTVISVSTAVLQRGSLRIFKDRQTYSNGIHTERHACIAQRYTKVIYYYYYYIDIRKGLHTCVRAYQQTSMQTGTRARRQTQTVYGTDLGISIHIYTYAREGDSTHSRTHARTHALTHARTHALTHARTHARTHTHTHTHTHA